MAKKIVLLIFVFLAVVLIITWYLLFFEKQTAENNKNISLDPSNVTDAEIISLLKTNSDSLDYIEKHEDFKIEMKTPLTKEGILAGQGGENFKEVYQGLDLEDNRYLRADLMNAAGDWGLIAVLDFKNNSVVKAFGLMMLNASVETE